MKKMLRIILFVIISLNLLAYTSEEYWEQLKNKADKIYQGLDLNFDVTAGVTKDTNEETAGELKFTIPLYSSSEKRVKRDEKQAFLDKGAELIRDIEVNQEYLQFLEQEEKIKQATVYEQGAKGAEQYFDLKKQIIETRAGIREAERKLESMLM